MLAGRVKLKTFVGVTGLVGLVAIGGAVAWVVTRPEPPRPPPPPPRPVTEPLAARTTQSRTAEPTTPVTPAPSGDSPAVRFLLEQAGRSLSGARSQDASPRTSWKVNLYQDEGFDAINRAKIDYDRDDRWDEKWTYFPDGRIERQISPADDEQYTQRLDWRDGAWVDPAAPVAAPTAEEPTAEEPTAEEPTAEEPTAAASAYPVLPAHRWLLRQVGRDLGADRIQEAIRGERYKINLYQDEGNAVMNRAKIDLDRDDRWDEKWTFHPDGRITIQVSPNDDDRHTDRYVWNGEGWDRE